jgi:hypothetical protein
VRATQCPLYPRKLSSFQKPCDDRLSGSGRVRYPPTEKGIAARRSHHCRLTATQRRCRGDVSFGRSHRYIDPHTTTNTRTPALHTPTTQRGFFLPQRRRLAIDQAAVLYGASSMSALPPKADVCGANRHVCFGPRADSCSAAKRNAIRSPRLRARVCSSGM